MLFKAGSRAPAILVGVFAAFGGLLYGYDTGNISGIIAMPYWLQTFGELQPDGTYILPSNNKSLVVSILSAGTFCGALLGYPFGDILGRRWGIISACLVFSIGVALQTASTTLPLFIVGRVIAGLGVGLVSCLVPLYQSECAPKWIRGAVVSCYQWFITIGLLVSAIADNGTKDIQSYACYRIPIALQFIWAAILASGMLFLPESPRYLIKKNRHEQAYKSLSRLNSTTIDDPQIDIDIKEIIANLELEMKFARTSYLDCFRSGEGRNLRRTLVGVFLQAWQQLTGINFICESRMRSALIPH